MIGIEGDYLFDCSISDVKDFIEFEEQFIFIINEYAGNIIPDFQMVFVSKQAKIAPLLHEGTLIKAKIGRTYDTLQDMQLYVTTFDSAKHGESHELFTISGFATPVSYPCDYKSASFSKTSAISAVIQIAKKTFKSVITNIDTSLDTQTWIQPFQSDRETIQKIIYRADLGDSFPASAITLDGKFIIKDIKKDLKTNNSKTGKVYDWKLVRNADEKGGREISYVGDAVLTSNSGMINKIIGYGFTLKSLILDTALFKEADISSSSVLANSNKVGGLTGVNKKKFAGLQQTENTHANYHKSYYYNITQLLSLSRIELHATVDNRYYPFMPLDKFMFIEADVNNSKLSDEYKSGMYYASFISRTIQERKMMTTIKLNRESMNQVK